LDTGDSFVSIRIKELNEQGYYAKDEQKGILISCIYFMMLFIKNSKHSSRRKSRRRNEQRW
jgi:hypothetical protein